MSNLSSDFCAYTSSDTVVTYLAQYGKMEGKGHMTLNCFVTWLQVGHDAYEETAGSLSTFELAGHTDSIVGVAFNASGTMLATGGMDGTCMP